MTLGWIADATRQFAETSGTGNECIRNKGSHDWLPLSLDF